MPPPGGGSGRGPAVELRLDTRDEGEWTVLDVDGEIDLSTAPGLRARIEQLIRGGTRRLVVSLEHVGFMDSSGLGALVVAMRGMREAGGRMALICSRESVLRVFTMTGLDRVFAIHASVAEAVGA